MEKRKRGSQIATLLAADELPLTAESEDPILRCEREGRLQSAERAVPTLSFYIAQALPALLATNLLSA